MIKFKDLLRAVSVVYFLLSSIAFASECSCPLTNPRHNWCDGLNQNACETSKCYGPASGDKTVNCSPFYHGSYCGCQLVDVNGGPTVVSPPVNTSESACVTPPNGAFIATKLYSKTEDDEPDLGYQVADCTL